jgi:hypothetical protein
MRCPYGRKHPPFIPCGKLLPPMSSSLFIRFERDKSKWTVTAEWKVILPLIKGGVRGGLESFCDEHFRQSPPNLPLHKGEETAI